jgi:hypothetical protein
MGDYIGMSIPPVSFDNLPIIYNRLNISDPKILFPLDGNDIYGNCTCAAVAHAITVYNGLIGKKNIMSRSDVIKIYKKLTGGEDTGLNELNVLNFWQSNIIDGDKILAYVKIDHKNTTHIKQAIQLFGGVYLGFQVQENADVDFDNKITWTPGKLTNSGHAVYATSYDAETVTVLTWGDTQKGTWSWWLETVDECYAILPPESTNIKFDGFDLQTLKNDLKLISN